MESERKHQLAHLLRIQDNGPWYAQYFLNPSLSTDDLLFVAKTLLCMLTMRFIMCGALRTTKLRSKHHILPTLFRPHIKPKKELKFAENFWYFCWHFVSFCWGVKVLCLEGLTADTPGWARYVVLQKQTQWYWMPTLAEQLQLGNLGWPLFPVPSYLRYYYLTQLSFWLSCFVFLWIETMRHDNTVFFIHHITTCILVTYSYTCSFWRIGLVILVIHDSADIYLYLAKSLHYLRIPDKVVDCIFLLFVTTFCLSRLVAFPVYCVWPSIHGNALVPVPGFIDSRWQIPGAVSLPIFLVVLQILHVFWFGLIVKMIMRTIKKPGIPLEDPRSDDEFDPPETPSVKSPTKPTKAPSEPQYRLRPRRANGTDKKSGF